MNIHHLELFYYVARHGGIMEAVRNMPYGIQQPAVSGQILQLESDLGAKLFQRRPFALTPPGEELYAFVKPFFESVDIMGEKLRGGSAQVLRLAAPLTALRDHLPLLLQSLREKFPRLKLTLREGSQPEVAPWVERQEVDMAITLLDGRESGGLNNVPLLDLPVVFLVPKKHPAQRSEDILAAVASGNEPMTLITLPQCELAPRSLQEFIKQRGLEWPVSIEVTAIELVEAYVTAGFGIGLTLDLPGHPFPKTTRAIPVDGIAPLRLSALWKGSMNSVMKELLELLQKSAKSLKSPSA